MSKLSERFVDEMKLKGFAESTMHVYVLEVRRLAKYHNKSPLYITNDEIKAFLLYLRKERKVCAQTLNVTLGGIKMFYRCLQPKRDLTPFRRLRVPFKLPAVFTQDEVSVLLDAVKSPKYKTILSLMYSTGLRIGECMRLKIADIDCKAMVVHVKNGKGSKDRNIPLSKSALALLRKYRKTYKPKIWLFEGCPSTRHLTAASVIIVFRKALKKSGIKKRARPHTLRHSFATHLLGQRCSLPMIQRFLGHKNIRATVIYTHITPTMLADVENPLDCLMEAKKKGGRSRA